ncbi:MAG: hypothetical protein HYT66_00235 [Candidatus Yanofskybacteria bacterium]|nr:hypothetical protein [Candidatus Yanofskybacteria bacterium]
MGATKIINVLKDDKFEELLDIVKETDASEVVFVLPKQARAFKSEGHFVVLADEAKDSDKSISFLCSNPEVNELAKKYKFDVLSTKTERPRALPAQAGEIASRVERQSLMGQGGEMLLNAQAISALGRPVAVKTNDIDDDMDEEDEEMTHEESKEAVEETPAEEETEYKEEEEPEVIEDKPPYGTGLDESGNTIYDEEEDGIGEVIVASAKTRLREGPVRSRVSVGMSDVVKPSAGKNIKVTQKDKRPVKIETRIEKDDIQSVWGPPARAGQGTTDNIWADIDKPRAPRQPSFKKRVFNFNSKNFPKKGLIALSASSLLILVIVIFITVGSARIEIRPQSQELSTQLKVTMSPNFSSIDNSFNRIPGQLFTISKSASDEFSATAEKDAIQKSRGTITIYNEYSTSPQPLVATTRFEYIHGGKESRFVFRTLQSVTVPGMKVENGVVTPGKINVEVIADKAGQDYNISAGDFGIVAWREKGDTARYDKIYGKSSESMHGGIFGKAKVVSEFDYNNAKDQLIEKVNNDINELLSTQSAGLELLTGIQPKTDSIESTAEIDDAAEKFTITVNGSIMTIGFKKEDLLSLISNYIDRTSGLMLIPEKLELSYKDAVINPTDNTLEVIVVLGGQGYAKIDQADITANLMGKNEAQIKDYLGSIQNIDSAKVTLSPFWVKKIPRNNKKIDILLTY